MVPSWAAVEIGALVVDDLGLVDQVSHCCFHLERHLALASYGRAAWEQHSPHLIGTVLHLCYSVILISMLLDTGGKIHRPFRFPFGAAGRGRERIGDVGVRALGFWLICALGRAVGREGKNIFVISHRRRCALRRSGKFLTMGRRKALFGDLDQGYTGGVEI